jgi:hypothetical protein
MPSAICYPPFAICYPLFYIKLPNKMLVLYSFLMNEFSVNRWRDHLNALGIGDLVDELFRPGSPLAIIAAQLLHVARPSLGAFADDSSLASLARFTDYLQGEENADS